MMCVVMNDLNDIGLSIQLRLSKKQITFMCCIIQIIVTEKIWNIIVVVGAKKKIGCALCFVISAVTNIGLTWGHFSDCDD